MGGNSCSAKPWSPPADTRRRRSEADQFPAATPVPRCHSARIITGRTNGYVLGVSKVRHVPTVRVGRDVGLAYSQAENLREYNDLREGANPIPRSRTAHRTRSQPLSSRKSAHSPEPDASAADKPDDAAPRHLENRKRGSRNRAAGCERGSEVTGARKAAGAPLVECLSWREVELAPANTGSWRSL